MDSYPSLPNISQQQQQAGYNNNSLGLPTNPTLLQQSQSQQYANFAPQHPANQRAMNSGIVQQSQQQANYGTTNNQTMQQLGGLGADNNSSLSNPYVFQNHQSLPVTSSTPIPSMSAINNSVYGNQGNINGMGMDVFRPGFNRTLGGQMRAQMQRLAQQTQQQQMMLQMRRPVQNTAPSQNVHRPSNNQKQTNDSNSKKPQQPIVKPYEPAPDLTPVQKEYLEQYVRRDNLYQKALDLQHRRQMAIINEKRKEIAQAEQRYQFRSSPFVFGPGYQGYGNGITGTKFRIIYPNERKRPKRTKEFKFTLQQLKDIAQKEDILVPIRLEIDGADGYKLRDTFTWNMNETFITPEHFAEVLCDDLHFPPSQFAPIIVKQIRDQLQGYIIHPLSSTEPPQPTLTAEVFSTLKNSTEDSIEIKEEIDEFSIFNMDVDQFEWDINCQKNDPEIFAEILTTELGLGGHPFDGSSIQDDDLRQNFLSPVTNIIRREDAVEQHTPLLVELTEAEIDKIEKDRERDARRKRRQTRGRRGVILPDREPPKTHRTLLHNTTLVQDPADENVFLTVPSSGMPPVLRKASSMGYDNYTAISEKSLAPGKMRGRGRATVGGANIGSNLRVGTPVNTQDSDSNTPEGAKKLHRRELGLTNKDLDEWHCNGCGCPSTSTPLLRKGPNGEKTLCNACGLYFQKNNSLRPNPLNLNDLGTNSPFMENNPSSIDLFSKKGPQHIESYHQNSPSMSISNTSLEVKQQSNTLVKREINAQDNQNLTDSQGITLNTVVSEGLVSTPLIQPVPSIMTASSIPSTSTTHAITSTSANDLPMSTTSSTITVSNALPSNRPVFPEWIIQQRDQLNRKYPRDCFDIIQRPNHHPTEFRIKCFDCPGKLYQPGPDLTLGNFEIHLKNKSHRMAVEKRWNPQLAASLLNNETIANNNNANTIPGYGHADGASATISVGDIGDHGTNSILGSGTGGTKEIGGTGTPSDISDDIRVYDLK
ncbi:11846_t:CDS:10 [Dentiscutata erythropus]|uniref:11846_t:CDS:1 n=1 Tax=Dentiscutata erythropus TaxID=1348616 RepID=A0A9N9D9E4_9GLOM|nr:11846_t:CDS:10 [Dentiscutata erythropus]